MITEHLELLNSLVEQGEPFALASVVRAEKPTSAKPGAAAIITLDGTLRGWVGGSCAEPSVRKEALRSLADGQPRLLRLCPPESLGVGAQEGVVEIALTCISGGTYEIYIEPQLVQPRLVVVGHLATTESMVKLGRAMGYPVSVVGYETSAERFPGAVQILDHIDFSALRITARTYIVVASHGNYDEEALVAALRTPTPYVSLVASPKRAQAVLQYLRDSDLPAGWEERFKFPAGLDFGAITADEIALSILAEIVQFHRRRTEQQIQQLLEAESAPTSEIAIDPICGMTVEVGTARYTLEHQGRIYYFCTAGCRHTFERNPENYRMKE
ncbi:MAG TPA: XdhC family protein [Anaerolineales bacterium]|nr:XdhC family protein [Anaerolineales bacterium]